jgi:S-formylglutathione hydrolase FrmB
MRRGLRTLAVVLLALGAPATARADGLQVVGTQTLSERLTDYTMRTPALNEDVHVRVLRPAGYDAGRRYPVLYLLNGCCEDWRSWTDLGDAERITAPYPLIVVMPEGGYDGNYTDWFNGGAFGPPMWETFHLAQLVPWVDGTFRTDARREGRVVAGLSMGGFGAFSYAARHPELFSAAASFSGVVDTNTSWGSVAVDYESIQGGKPPFGPFGPRATEEVRWRAHNPWDLAENLRGIPLTLRTGNGLPGGGEGSGLPDAIEDLVHRENVSLHERLAELRIDHVWDDYGPGQHEWPYWSRGLKQTLPWLMGVLADPPAPPERVTFTAAEPAYRAYGWRVSFQRSELEFSTLRDARRGGFTLEGRGRGLVVTPPVYRRRCAYDVNGSELRPDATRRLRIPVAPDGRVDMTIRRKSCSTR